MQPAAPALTAKQQTTLPGIPAQADHAALPGALAGQLAQFQQAWRAAAGDAALSGAPPDSAATWDAAPAIPAPAPETGNPAPVPAVEALPERTSAYWEDASSSDDAAGSGQFDQPLPLAMTGQFVLTSPLPELTPLGASAGAQADLVALLEQHVVQWLASPAAAQGEVGSQMLVKLADHVLAGAQLTLIRAPQGWTLKADADPFTLNLLRRSSTALSARFAERGLGSIDMELSEDTGRVQPVAAPMRWSL